MTPEELKQQALKASTNEYNEVIDKLKIVASEGSFSAKFSSLSDGTVKLLKDNGYKVKSVLMGRSNPYYGFEVSFS